jgi:FixJ family two-component response regulator
MVHFAGAVLASGVACADSFSPCCIRQGAVITVAAVEKALELGAVDYITKPFTVRYLEDTVEAKIATHLLCA